MAPANSSFLRVSASRRSSNGSRLWRLLGHLIAALAPCVVIAVPALAEEPKVVSSSGDVLLLSVGSDYGVAVGATGRLSYMETIGGREIVIFPVAFEVVEVSTTQASARVLRGDVQSITIGMTVVFDRTKREGDLAGRVRQESSSETQRLSSKAPGEPRAGREASPISESGPDVPSDEAVVATLLREAENLLSVGDFEGAEERFLVVVNNHSGDARLDYARRMADGLKERRSRANSEAAVSPAEEEVREKATTGEATNLVNKKTVLLDVHFSPAANRRCKVLGKGTLTVNIAGRECVMHTPLGHDSRFKFCGPVAPGLTRIKASMSLSMGTQYVSSCRTASSLELSEEARLLEISGDLECKTFGLSDCALRVKSARGD